MKNYEYKPDDLEIEIWEDEIPSTFGQILKFMGKAFFIAFALYLLIMIPLTYIRAL